MSSGCTPSSAGISGKTAAPSGTSGAGSLISASRHRRDDGQLVAVLDRRVQRLQEADVLVVEVDVHELPELAVVEQARGERRVLGSEIVEDPLHGRSRGLHGG